jgi:catechol 2,3-dioxygenase-like lactoylglutathione lyase family enzyme
MNSDRERELMDWKIQLIVMPVTDVDRAKEFYTTKIGFNVDFDASPTSDVRFVQLTPPGSACSIAFGTGLTDMTPGSVRGNLIVVPDIEAAHKELTARGAEVSEIDDQQWGRFVYFRDPDGNGWSVQQLPARG